MRGNLRYKYIGDLIDLKKMDFDNVYKDEWEKRFSYASGSFSIQPDRTMFIDNYCGWSDELIDFIIELFIMQSRIIPEDDVRYSAKKYTRKEKK